MRVIEPHSVWRGSFRLFGVDLKCHVLSDGQRIIEEDSMEDFFRAIDKPLDDQADAAVDELVRFVEWMQEGRARSVR